MKKQKKDMSGCPILYGMGMFGDKWTLLIIRDILFMGKRYYNEFLNSDGNISTNILADRLASLEVNGIISKTLDETNRSKYIYNLTEKGKDLLPVMLSIVEWSEKYDENTKVPDEFINKLRQNPKKLQKEILKAMEKAESVIKSKEL
jgi:DNA-binding HxlR family transcriptional regulator